MDCKERNPCMKLSGKTAVVTGASRGIGRAAALRLAQDGANVAVLYASNKEKAQEVSSEITALGREANIWQCEVGNDASVKQTVSEITERFGQIDILINNAGITKDKLMLMMKPQDFDSVIDTNLRGVFLMTRYVSACMVRQKSGTIINISSVAGLMGNAGQVNYAAAKAGIIGMTKSVARELASRGITCNAIAPGFIDTDMTSGIPANHPMLANIPLKRSGKPEEVAALIAFLASKDATYITGEVIRIDGGLAM